MESMYLEGRARVLLSSLTSDELDVDHHVLQFNIDQTYHPDHIISVRITPEARDDILRAWDTHQNNFTQHWKRKPLL